MNLRDLKPGDRFTAEFEVMDVEADRVVTTSHHVLFFGAENLHNATKLPPRARPVRKGDVVKPESSPVTVTFLALWDNTAIIWRDGYGCDSYASKYVTHADGAPIDWEASE